MQEPTDDTIPTSIRNACQTILCFNLAIDAHVTALFGKFADGSLPEDPRKLTRGTALLKNRETGAVNVVRFPVLSS